MNLLVRRIKALLVKLRKTQIVSLDYSLDTNIIKEKHLIEGRIIYLNLLYDGMSHLNEEGIKLLTTMLLDLYYTR